MAKGIIPLASGDLALHRPQPMLPKPELPVVTAAADPIAVAGHLIEGGRVVIRDAYPTGLKILSQLRERIFGSGKGDISSDKVGSDDFLAYRNRRAAYREASNRLLVPVSGNRIALKKAPAIGWLDELYPDVADFLLPFPQVQGLNSSWQWFLKGVRFPLLRHEIYPWYGTYFPTRFDHLLLFDRWLKRFSGSKKSAMDVGTGCGVLAFMMLERGFEYVLATDINPNAVMTVRENARHRGVESRIDAKVADLFEGCGRKSDLIVCNPPWLPGEPELPEAGPGLMDKAICYEPDFFERFFSAAVKHLEEDGRLVILFSNLGLAEGLQVRHPVEEELASNRRFVKVQMLRQKAKPPSTRTRRRDHRKEEYVELWELALHT
jgi:tRNA1(Val) A37 N6-methylase TrmN6